MSSDLPPPPDEPAFLPELLRELATSGPLTVDALSERLAVDEPQLERELGLRVDVVETLDGWRSVWPLVDGAVLTHLVDAQELELGMLTADGDLDLWARLADEGLPLAGGGEVRTRWHDQPGAVPDGATTALTGPDGWLTGCVAEQLVGLRLSGGALSVEPYEQVPPPPHAAIRALVTAAMAVADAAVVAGEEEPGTFIDEVVLEALMRDGAVLAEPVPPLSVLFLMAGLEVRRGLVGLPGADWDGSAGASRLSTDQRRRLARLRAVLATTGRARADDTALLQQSAVLLAADDEVLAAVGADVAADSSKRQALDALAAAVPGAGRERAAAVYLQAVAADGAAEPDRAQQHLDEALTAASDLRPALELAGNYAAERGDAFSAERLYRAAGRDATWPWRQLLREFLQAPPQAGARNRPCACGSGRKFKLCCAAKAQHPLPRRALWRYRRALAFGLQAPHQALLVGLAEAMTGPYADDPHEALADPLVPDLALVEGDVLGDYLARRGPLMPADEVALVERWRRTPLTLLEVLDTRPGREVTLRALPDGEPTVVCDRVLSGEVQRLDLLLGRLLDDGERLAFLTPPRLVPRERRPQLMAVLSQDELDPYEVAAALAPRGLPELRTREGEEMVMCTARYAVADLDRAWTTLSVGLEQDDDALIEVADVGGEDIVRGTVRRVAGGLEIETNALERLRRLQELVLHASPAARLISESSVPAAELMIRELAEGESPAPPHPSPQVPPEVLASMGEQYEQRWLDDSIPALGGLTPRQASEDPAARRELEALLDDFAWRERHSDQPAIMQAARLRSALGLPDTASG
ncbi:MAG: SEC-C metal-binding domain-containing protein, partial [Mycobacteriales bacterium]